MRIKEKLGEIGITASARANRFPIPALGYLVGLELVARDVDMTSTDATVWIEDGGMHLFNRIELFAGPTTIRALSGRAAFYRWKLDHRHKPYYLEGALTDGDGALDVVIPIELVTPRSFNPLATALNTKWFGRDGVSLQITFGAAGDVLSNADAAFAAGQVVEVVGIYEESLDKEPKHFRTMEERVKVFDDGANSQESINFDDIDGLRSVLFISTDAASDKTKDATMGNIGTWRIYGNTLGEGRKRIEETLAYLAWLNTYHEAGLPEISQDGLLANTIHNDPGVWERHWDLYGQLDTLAVRSKMSNLVIEMTGVNAAADKLFYTTEVIEAIPGMNL